MHKLCKIAEVATSCHKEFLQHLRCRCRSRDMSAPSHQGRKRCSLQPRFSTLAAITNNCTKLQSQPRYPRTGAAAEAAMCSSCCSNVQQQHQCEAAAAAMCSSSINVQQQQQQCAAAAAMCSNSSNVQQQQQGSTLGNP